MMFELLLDVMDRFLNLRDTNAECAIVTPIIQSMRTPARITPYPNETAFLGWRSHRPSGTLRNRLQRWSTDRCYPNGRHDW
jgi:hypothetical protein